MYLPSRSDKQKTFEKNIFFVGILATDEKKAGSGSESHWYGSVPRCQIHNTDKYSFVDPDVVGSGTFSRIRIRSGKTIPDPGSSGSANEF
jgi:hypothetical protein